MDHVFIIAEAGVNHNGKFELALKMCDEAKKAGVDAIKFQTWKTENVVTKDVLLANYQANNTSVQNGTQYEMLRKIELTYDQFGLIKKYCDKIGLDFMSTADEEESLDYLISIGLQTIKVGSGEITNIPFLRNVGRRNTDIILSTGMSYLSDVDIAYRTLMEAGANSVSLLHCTTNYPCPMNEVNLRAMITLKKAFHCKVGYSDHTLGIEVPIAAVAMGAEIIEKHFTIDKTMEGPDHKASIDPKELKQMITSIRNIEDALGNGIKVPNESEKSISLIVQKRIVAKTEIHKGELLTPDKITIKRSDTGLSASLWDLVINQTAKQDFSIDQPIYLF